MTDVVRLATGDLPLTLRRHAGARRLALRLRPDGDGVVVTVPQGVSAAEGLDFASRHAAWLEQRLASLPPRMPFTAGTVLPVLGSNVVIEHRPEARTGARRNGHSLIVSGLSEHLTRRVTDWLRREARREFAERSFEFAARLDRRPKRIRTSDPRTRWGSCGADGTLSYSWRLMLAPETVADYVVAHEVAHLAVRNHGPAFWRTVASICDGVDAARVWLRRHGPTLHRYG